VLANFVVDASAGNHTLAGILAVPKEAVRFDSTRCVPRPLPPHPLALDHLDMVLAEAGRSEVVAVEVMVVIIEYVAVMAFCDDSP
jgi:hypothetical protein